MKKQLVYIGFCSGGAIGFIPGTILSLYSFSIFGKGIPSVLATGLAFATFHGIVIAVIVAKYTSPGARMPFRVWIKIGSIIGGVLGLLYGFALMAATYAFFGINIYGLLYSLILIPLLGSVLGVVWGLVNGFVFNWLIKYGN